MICLKESRFFLELANWPGITHDLALVAHDAAEWHRQRSVDMVITSVYRNPAEQAKVNPKKPHHSPHGTKPVRGMDIRIKGLPSHYPALLCRHLNDKYEYDPSRPTYQVAVLEIDHIHLQVHPNTTPRGAADEELD